VSDTDLNRLRRRGELKLVGKFAELSNDEAWEAFCDQLRSIDWGSFIQPPPTETSSAEQVVHYLTRYLTGGPISDGRIVSADRERVTILAREGARTGGDRAQVPVEMTTLEFTRLWCLHVQTDGLTKVRHFGGWSNRRRTAYLDHCREILASIRFDPSDRREPSDEPADESVSNGVAGDESDEVELSHRCPACECESLRLIAETPKPSRAQVLDHLDTRCPSWHADASKAELIEYLEREYWVDYDTWVSETRIENAREPSAPGSASQLFLPGFSAGRSHLLESN